LNFELSPLKSPVLDFFRRGEAATDVRLLAARGALAAPAVDQLSLLVLLCSDADAAVREAAEGTLARLPAALVAGVIASAEVPADVRDFFAARGIRPAPTPLTGADPLLQDEDDTDYGPEPATEAEKALVIQKIAAMSIPERLKAAMRGTREMRGILIRDPHKLIALMVLRSPKVSESEVETFAKMGSVDTDVLRAISQTRAWMKNYAIALALVKNAKTPLSISLTLLKRLHDGDLRRLSLDRNVPEALRVAARRKVVTEGR
jgi:hypothetical protein